MHAQSLFKWLAQRANSYNTSIQSSYFFFGKIVIRYSNHFAKNSTYNLDVIRTDNFYIIHMHEYGIPKIYAKVADVKQFIEHYLFIYGTLVQSALVSEKAAVPEIKEDKAVIPSNAEDIVIKDVRYQQLDKDLKTAVHLFITNNPNKLNVLFNEFLIPYSSKRKQTRLNHWLQFKKKYG